MHSNQRTLPLGFVLAGLLLFAVGCKPDYPTCETDKDCKEKEFCVARKCQQCRDSRDCGEGKACDNGKCSVIAGYCTDKSQCPAGQECIANRCRPCEADSECPSGLICLSGQCSKAQCSKDEECAQDEECQNGRCVSARDKSGKAPCPLEPIYFGFDQASLSSEATNALSANSSCLKSTERAVDVVGRADPRGTTEYNLALSDRRASAVKEYLQRLGIDSNRLRPVPRGALDAVGTDDSTWSKDRRVDFDWK